MILALIEEKLTKITGKCQDLLSQAQTIGLVVAKLIGLLSPTVQYLFQHVFKHDTYDRNRLPHLKKKVHTK